MTPIEKYYQGAEYNDCERLFISISRMSDEDPSTVYARCVVITLLSRAENLGKHNLYLDVIDKDGKQIRNSVLKGRNNNIQLTAKVDKPPAEFGTNFSLFTQDTVDVWVDSVPGVGKIVSDIARGFSTRWGGDIVGGQDYGHVSYYVIFQVGKEPGEELPPVTDCKELKESFEQLKLDYASLSQKLEDIKKIVIMAS